MINSVISPLLPLSPAPWSSRLRNDAKRQVGTRNVPLFLLCLKIPQLFSSGFVLFWIVCVCVRAHASISSPNESAVRTIEVLGLFAL